MIIKKYYKGNKRKGKTWNNYRCDWCGYEFDLGVDNVGDGKQSVSTQVKCPTCTNFIPTWE